ncbi:MAG: methylmalonyl Co-A mutase-associated GTPase MeaB [Chloroflexi bacterium]|nr:methylmalonyl Co-A mutase-associated GTPase MeaB [Chloroflexota bacterium]
MGPGAVPGAGFLDTVFDRCYPAENRRNWSETVLSSAVEALVERMLQGNQGALARLITLVESDAPETPFVLARLYGRLGHAYSVGVTGPPGAGKSTLVDQLAGRLRQRGLSVGIVAVDPTSPFSGGSVLGDRIRMQRHYLDEGVFIRSMATRGSQGGLPITAQAVVHLLDAFGKDLILIETVGVGQTELDIMGTADTVVVVLVPEAGDTIQTMKAGLLEIADILVVNKADRDGARSLQHELENMLHLAPRKEWWEVPVLLTVAHRDEGVAELLEAVGKHRAACAGSGERERRLRRRRRQELLQSVEQRLKVRLLELVEHDHSLSGALAEVEEGRLDPYSAARAILADRALLHKWFAELEQVG